MDEIYELRKALCMERINVANLLGQLSNLQLHIMEEEQKKIVVEGENNGDTGSSPV